MSLRNRLNLAFIIIFALGLLSTTTLVYVTELQQARQSVLADAEVLLSTALSMRSYTIDQVSPLLVEQSKNNFLPQTVPSYAVQTMFALFQQEYPEFSYREPVLNPTNPRDRATAWESEIIQRFIATPDLARLTGARETEYGRVFYIARPVQITNEACLECHSTPDIAPVSMIEQYGSLNGFGWKLNEILGAQVITVPANAAFRAAIESTLTQVVSLFSVFTLVLIASNVILGQAFLRPLEVLTQKAEHYSKGDLSAPEFVTERKDEIGSLERSMNRLRRTVDTLLKDDLKDT